MAVDTLWVRHGESVWNRARLMQGQTSWPELTSVGIRQAHAAAETLRQHTPVRILSSDLRRASETADIIGSRLCLPIRHSALLRERCWGIFEGQPVAQGYRAEAALAADEAVPQGESRDAVAVRLRRFAAQSMTGEHPIVVVTHGDVIREAVRLWGCDKRVDRVPDNGAVVRILVDQRNRSKQA